MTAAHEGSPTAFVSWAHGDEAWQTTIARFVFTLRELGVDADVDLFHAHAPGVDWSTYGPAAIKENDFVLIAASSAYKTRWEEQRTSRTGAGAAREARVLKDLFDTDPVEFNKKVMVVILPGASQEDVPSELGSGLPRFLLPDVEEACMEDLLRRLTGQPAYRPSPVGAVPTLPPVFMGDLTFGSPASPGSAESVVANLDQRLARVDADIEGMSDADDTRIGLEVERATVKTALEFAVHESQRALPSWPPSRQGRRFARDPSVVVLGCSIGRRSARCGALKVRAARKVPNEGEMELLSEGRGTRVGPDQRGSEALYDELTAAIVSTTRDVLEEHPAARIAAIGIGTPGVVEVTTGRLALSVTLPEGSDIPWEVAQRVVAASPELIERAFGVPRGDPRQLADRVLVDNDVRCIARHCLSHHVWPNFACVYVGSGVGAGVVVDGRVYYGANGSAGHIGHIELGRERTRWPLDAEHELEPIECECGITGFHFEPMASFAGLERIADCLADDDIAMLMTRIRDAYAAAGHEPLDFYGETFPRLLALAHRREPAGVPRPALALVEDRSDLDDYLGRVLRAHASILATGIATLVEVVDPGNVVLCGPFIDALRGNDVFFRTLRRLLPQQIFNAPSAPAIIAEANVGDALWRGAALLPCERGFPASVELPDAQEAV